VLVVHGLDVSKEIMQLLSAALADAGFEVYSIDLPGHGDSTAPFSAPFAEDAIRNVVTSIGGRPMVVGHSLGAGLLLDLAADQDFSSMVLLSPPPTSLEQIHADRVLVVSGRFDVPRIRTFAPVLAGIGEPHLEWWYLRWAGHSSAIFNPVYVRRIVQWLGGNGSQTRTGARLMWAGLMFIAAVVAGVALLPGRAGAARVTATSSLLVRYVGAAGLAIVVLKILVPLRWLHLFAADYLVSFLLLSGLLLLVQQREPFRFSGRGAAKSAGAAAFVIVVLGIAAGGQVLHMSLNSVRWWRFPIIALASLPLFAVDELWIRSIAPRWKSNAVAVITRVLLGAFVLTGILVLNRESAFLVLIVHLVVMFWVALWFAADVVHRHTQNPYAAAVFAALVQGWAFAALFVTT
jgi:pimeloyl-ACP methyl ester carboxylesterase